MRFLIRAEIKINAKRVIYRWQENWRSYVHAYAGITCEGIRPRGFNEDEREIKSSGRDSWELVAKQHQTAIGDGTYSLGNRHKIK